MSVYKVFLTGKTKTDSSQRLLNSAIKLFVKKGYRGASVGAITKAAGRTRGALYCHFKSKEHLAVTIIRLFEEKFLDGMMNSVETGGKSASEKFEKMMRFAVWYAKEDPNLLLFMTRISAEMVGSRNGLNPILKPSIRDGAICLQEF